NAGNVVINADNMTLLFPSTNVASPDYNLVGNNFTAPLAGTYEFTVTLGLNSVTGGQASIGFSKNGIIDTTSIVRFTGVQPVSLTKKMKLVEGDSVEVKSFLDPGQSFDYRGFISSFSGILSGN